MKPDVILLTNALLSGMVPELRRALGVPVFVTLQGDDIFLDALPEADRRRCIELIRENCANVAGFICTSRYYADYMADYLGLPREKMHVVYPGSTLAGHGGARTVQTNIPLTIGYFARICPEKGFHNLVEAFIRLRQTPGAPAAKLKASGWLGENQSCVPERECESIERGGPRGPTSSMSHLPSHADKVRFLQSIDVLSVPTVYREPKGLYVLEAWANGVPVVQPRHGAFPELIEATGGGLLVAPDDTAALADGLRRMLEDHDLRDRRRPRRREQPCANGSLPARWPAKSFPCWNATPARRYTPHMTTPFTTTRRVEFGDTDMAGIMHFANFFRFMESAETSFLHSLGLSVSLARGRREVGLSARVGLVRLPEAGAIRGRADHRGHGRESRARSRVSYRFDFTNQHGEALAVGRITDGVLPPRRSGATRVGRYSRGDSREAGSEFVTDAEPYLTRLTTRLIDGIERLAGRAPRTAREVPARSAKPGRRLLRSRGWLGPLLHRLRASLARRVAIAQSRTVHESSRVSPARR